MSTPSGISQPLASQPSQPYSQPTILHQNKAAFTAITIDDDSDNALFVSGGSSEDPSRSIFDSDAQDDAGERDSEGDGWVIEEEDSLEEEARKEARIMLEVEDSVNFVARWRVLCGKDNIGDMQNTEEESCDHTLSSLFV